MKVAFHLHNDGIEHIDLSMIERGNPGIGGSEYLAVLVAVILAMDGHIDVVSLPNKPCLLPKVLPYCVCGDVTGAIDYCRNNDIDILVIDPKYFPKDNQNKVDTSVVYRYPEVKFILWANNFISISIQKKLLSAPNVLRIVNVGREEYDLYRDCSFFHKTTYIYNAFPLNNYRGLIPNNRRPHHVVYIGNLVRIKGFHVLAKAWPKIVSEVPDAELFVIGSGKLYDRNNKLGKWGVAEEKYEKLFMPYLVSNNRIMPSVHFLGILGEEKNDVIAHCKVGVPNPAGESETFGYTALEMQSLDCKVTTIKCPAYLDTVKDKECLYNHEKDLADYVIRLLKDDCETKYDETIDWIKAKFSTEVICKEWLNLLTSDLMKPAAVQNVNNNYHMKYFKEAIRIMTPLCIKQNLPSLERLYRLKYRIKALLKVEK